MPNHVQTKVQLWSFHMLGKLCLISFTLGFISTWTEHFQIYKMGFKESEIKFITFIVSWGKQGNSRKTSTSASLTTLKLWLWRSQQTGKFLKRWEYQTILFDSWKTCMGVKKQQLELDMEQLTGSKLGKEYVKAEYCHPAYLTYMHNTSYKMLGWMNHKLVLRLSGKLSAES